MTRPGTKHIAKNKGRDTIERFLIDREREYMREQQPEAALWCRTVRQAWSDAFYKPNDGTKVAPALIKRDAIKFLTEGSRYERDRDFVCVNCDISPEWIREQTHKALKEGPPQPYPPITKLEQVEGLRQSITNHFVIRQMEKAAEKKKTFDIPDGI
jgi:hypothetical protein